MLFSCSGTKKAAGDSPLQSHITEVLNEYAPDKRTALFDVTAREKVLVGETNLPAAKAVLLQRLTNANLAYVDSIKLLPASDLAGKQKAVVTVSVANLRTQGKHAAELATQAMLGTPLQVLKKQMGWYLVQTPDNYIAWVDGGGIALMDNEAFARWQQQSKIVYTSTFGFAYASPDVKGLTVSDLVYGDVLEIVKQREGFYETRFPDGRIAYVPLNDVVLLKDWMQTRNPTEQNLVNSGKQLMGLPYLWGGTSAKGVDCSGFTKMVYFMNGLVLPRDASQQVHVGELVDTKNGWNNMKPGDLLFFGSPASEGRPERVVHVGMWIGGKEFIHASNYVRTSSMDSAAVNFDKHELSRFLRAKRISPSASLYDFRVKSFY
ncbi:MAG: glycoside hydrolase [Segetibacter sp.]|nr:glycoside hydrolase [Segetibacter sp.]